MIKTVNRDAGLQTALREAGGVYALAKMLDIKPPSVSGWRKIPAERVIEIERLLDRRVTRHQMRPDLYPLEDGQEDAA